MQATLRQTQEAVVTPLLKLQSVLPRACLSSELSVLVEACNHLQRSLAMPFGEAMPSA